jgi:ubiquinone/menaquinone biosynthesis C-methylase UbiE
MDGPGLTGREFEPVAEHAGSAYLRYSFTKGTEQEVRFLARVLGLEPGMRVLDVGCGPGRHCHALSRLGIEMVGADISQPFLEAAGAGRWVRADARELPVRPKSFDAAISLCQGGFGLLGGADDGLVLAEMSRLVKAGGRLALSAFSAYFAVRHLDEGDTFDAGPGVHHERAEVRNPTGQPAEFDLWTTCFTPRELRLMAAEAGISVEAIWSVAPGNYAERRPDLDHPEFLLVGGV